MTTSAPKYPFTVTVMRNPGHGKPVLQQYNFERLGEAYVRLNDQHKDRSVLKAVLSVILEEQTFYSHHPRQPRSD